MNRIIAFEGTRRIAEGAVAEVALATKQVMDSGTTLPVLILDSESSQPVELDFRGTPEEVAERLREPQEVVEARRPGRPKLGVVPREVTLLPRHWEWLSTQPGGASVALRKLVEEARRKGEGKERMRRAQEAAYRFLTTMAGNEPGYEEALRALFARDADRFTMYASAWPADVSAHARKLATRAFDIEGA